MSLKDHPTFDTFILMFRSISYLFVIFPLGSYAQSIMYSPVAASSPDLTLDDGSTYANLYDQSGLSFEFTSGSTNWPSEMCTYTHNFTAYLESWSVMDWTLDTAHLLLDMGDTLTWDRMAFFNEEAQGFGLDPILIEYSLAPTGPWQVLCSWELTNHPFGTFEYPPDILYFPYNVTTRYFRIRGSTPDFYHQFVIAEIILGTASLSPPVGSCLRTCLASGMATQADDQNDWITTIDPAGHQFRLSAAVTKVRCFDALGREVPIRYSNNVIDTSGLLNGVYIIIASVHHSMRTLRFVKSG